MQSFGDLLGVSLNKLLKKQLLVIWDNMLFIWRIHLITSMKYYLQTGPVNEVQEIDQKHFIQVTFLVAEGLWKRKRKLKNC